MLKILLLMLCPILLVGQNIKHFNVEEIQTNSLITSFENNEVVNLTVTDEDGIVLKKGVIETLGEQSIQLENLDPATIYQVHLHGENIDTSFYTITASRSSGEIEIIFNTESNTSYSDGSLADGYTGNDIERAMLDMIEDAEHTLDVMAYNTNRTILINSLIDAHVRGVQVRYIADQDQNNLALETSLPFEVLFGSIGQGIMHNKVIIKDAEETDLAKVLTGSTNLTTGQMFYDPNHIITIQDESLAKAYTVEFEEMWGSSDLSPNLANAKFGDQKSDNTPHFFDINGVPMELYFSPSDREEDRVVEEIEKADDQLLMALLLITRYEFRDAIIEAYNESKDFRMIVEDEEFSDEILPALEQADIPVQIHLPTEIFHHKYAIIDEESVDPTVITGSMNWTFSGGEYNDENTLIIKDKSIANIFRQDFEAQWLELTPTYEIDDQDLNFEVYNDHKIFSVEVDNFKTLAIYNLSGRLITSGTNNSISIAQLSSGVYLANVNFGQGQRSVLFHKG